MVIRANAKMGIHLLFFICLLLQELKAGRVKDVNSANRQKPPNVSTQRCRVVCKCTRADEPFWRFLSIRPRSGSYSLPILSLFEQVARQAGPLVHLQVSPYHKQAFFVNRVANCRISQPIDRFDFLLYNPKPMEANGYERI